MGTALCKAPAACRVVVLCRSHQDTRRQTVLVAAGGYSALVQRLAAGLEVRLQSPVSRISFNQASRSG